MVSTHSARVGWPHRTYAAVYESQCEWRHLTSNNQSHFCGAVYVSALHVGTLHTGTLVYSAGGHWCIVQGDTGV